MNTKSINLSRALCIKAVVKGQALSGYKPCIHNLKNQFALYFFNFKDVLVYCHPLVSKLIFVVCCTSRNHLTALIAISRIYIHMSFLCKVKGFQKKGPLKETRANWEKKRRNDNTSTIYFEEFQHNNHQQLLCRVF